MLAYYLLIVFSAGGMLKNTLLKLALSLSVAGTVGFASKPNYYQSNTTYSLEINHSIPKMAGEWYLDYRLAGLQFGSKIEDSTITVPDFSRRGKRATWQVE